MEKIINPELLASLQVGEPEMKIFKTGISFNRAAQKLLALKQHSQFVIVQKETGGLFYKDVVKQGFVIAQEMKIGGCRAKQLGMLNYLFKNSADPVKFSIGELEDGMRKLTILKSDLPE